MNPWTPHETVAESVCSSPLNLNTSTHLNSTGDYKAGTPVSWKRRESWTKTAGGGQKEVRVTRVGKKIVIWFWHIMFVKGKFVTHFKLSLNLPEQLDFHGPQRTAGNEWIPGTAWEWTWFSSDLLGYSVVSPRPGWTSTAKHPLTLLKLLRGSPVNACAIGSRVVAQVQPLQVQFRDLLNKTHMLFRGKGQKQE